MPVYKYTPRSGTQITVEGVVIPSTGVQFNYDNTTLNPHVPVELLRFVDGVYLEPTPVYTPTPLIGAMDSNGEIVGFVKPDKTVQHIDKLIEATYNPLTGKITSLVDPSTNTSVDSQKATQALVTVAIGNSISAQSKYGGFNNWWTTKAELHIANALAKGALRFKRMTASTRADQFGVYGYSGQTLPTILGDLGAQLYTPLATAGITPDLVVGLALAENDIASGATVDSIKSNILTFVRDIKARYPGAILLLCTPRPSFSNDTANKVSAYQNIRDYTLSFDNGYDIFVSRLDGYENPSSPGTPLGTSAAPTHTDNTVHPNGRGAMVNARTIADTILRIASRFQHPYHALSVNMALSGTGAASGTNVSGTVPTSASIAGSTNGTYVSTAENPGHLIQITANASGTEPPVDLATQNYGSISYTGGANTQISAFVEIELVEGSENLAWIQFSPRYAGSGGGNVFMDYIKRNTNDINPVFNNGDKFLFRTPPIVAADVTGLTGNISGVTPYVRLWTKITGGKVVFRVLNTGINVVVA